jgi:hypothetical protein|tara:strand:+ start:18673 stop:18813 length:141 start_codon:yes stop_codon:yes gene_type:complete
MSKKKKLNSRNPKYLDNVEAPKIKKEILINNKKGVTIKAVWYEQNN